MFVFRKIWCALFSCYLRFEIHPFALLPMNYASNSCLHRKYVIPEMQSFHKYWDHFVIIMCHFRRQKT